MKLLILFPCLLTFVTGYTQTCSIRSNSSSNFLSLENFEQEKAVFFSIEFSFNGIPFKTTSGDEKTIPVNQHGFDTIRYSYVWQGKRIEATSLCKFRENEQYTISPCVCCGIFLITPETQAERGFVQFVNKSSELLLGTASELAIDSIPAKSKTDFQFSSISMNCGFRPSQIAVFDPSYADPKFDYENTSKLPEAEQAILEAEQSKFIRYTTDFLFLHGERLVLTIDKASRFNLKLK